MNELLTSEKLVLEIEKSRKYFTSYMLQFKNNRGYWDEGISDLQLKILDKNISHVRHNEFKNYVIKSLRNSYIDLGRSKRMQTTVYFRGNDANSQEITDYFFVNYSEKCDYDNKGKDLFSFINRAKLKDICKELLILYYIEEYSVKEIQVNKQLSESNVKYILFAGRNELRELLEFKGINTYHKALSIFNT